MGSQGHGDRALAVLTFWLMGSPEVLITQVPCHSHIIQSCPLPTILMTFYFVLQSAICCMFWSPVSIFSAVACCLGCLYGHWFPPLVPQRGFFFFFSLSQSIIPADYSVCHSVLRFITILGFILSYTCSQASFISFSGASRMEEVAINRRKDVMLAGSVMSKFMVCKFQIRALALDPPFFSLQVTEPSRILTSKLTLWMLYTLSGLCEQRISLYLCKFTHMSSPSCWFR